MININDFKNIVEEATESYTQYVINSYEPVITGISKKYFHATDYLETEDLEQELWLQAVQILKDDINTDRDYVIKSCLNKATDVCSDSKKVYKKNNLLKDSTNNIKFIQNEDSYVITEIFDLFKKGSLERIYLITKAYLFNVFKEELHEDYISEYFSYYNKLPIAKKRFFEKKKKFYCDNIIAYVFLGMGKEGRASNTYKFMHFKKRLRAKLKNYLVSNKPKINISKLFIDGNFKIDSDYLSDSSGNLVRVVKENNKIGYKLNNNNKVYKTISKLTLDCDPEVNTLEYWNIIDGKTGSSKGNLASYL